MKPDEIILKNNDRIPRIGIGTWYLGDSAAAYEQEKAAIRAGLDAGMSLIDTAEMYGNGNSERLVGDAIQGYNREKLYLISKVLPHNAGRKHLEKSLDRTLKNMKVDYLDMYLLHWRGSIPFAETVDCMEEMKAKGKIKAWGVSNLDTNEMKELLAVPGGENCMVNQVLYHLGSRGVEYELLPWLEKHQIPLMAYCPLAQAGSLRRGLASSPAVKSVAQAHNITPMQVLLAFILRQPNVFAIPRSSHADHVLENDETRIVELTAEEINMLDKAFPAPERKTYLDMV